MRAVLALLITPLVGSLVGCSTLLGIQEPSTGSGSGSDAGSGSGGDAGVDAMTNMNGDHVEISIGDFRIAKQQMVRFHVMLVHEDGTKIDVTTMSGLSLMSIDTSVATIDTGHPGTVIGATPGTSTIRATYAGASATINATVTDEVCHLVINELQVAGASADDEWVELYNPCTGTIDVDGWTLDYRAAGTNGLSDSVTMVTLNAQITPNHEMTSGQILLIASQSYVLTPKDGSWQQAGGILSGTAGAVGLRAGAVSVGTLIDSVAYGNTVVADNPFKEVAAAPAIALSTSVSRSPFDGKDGNNNSMDFKPTAKTTPRALNVP